MNKVNVGILGTGIYLPKSFIDAKEIALATGGIWEEWAIRDKLGINKKTIPSTDDGTQEMGVKAALDVLKNTSLNSEEIDVILCIGEEWKEYPLTTSALYIQHRIGAINAWGIDLQNRCCTSVSAMKIAKDMLLSDSEINIIMIVGGYRNGDLVDYQDKNLSMMYNLSAGGGAIILKKNHNKNILLGTHIITDGSLSRSVGVSVGGTLEPISHNNLEASIKPLKIMEPEKMKTRLNEVSMNNWIKCIEKAFEKSKLNISDLDYLAVLHFKRSMHKHMLNILGLQEKNSIYLSDYGHIGQIDQILSLHLALKSGIVKNGSVISMIAAGIGYVWAANVIKWGDECV